ncbi:MAG: histidine triad family protein [Patescibacteria group bacterium]|nr:histidine triad family protein [Patescibacteria group bacterium]
MFTKIIRGEIPCHKVYEDEHTLAFLDINPAQPGHTLVVPKKQVEFVWDLDDETYLAVMRTAKKIGNRLREVMGRRYVGEIIVGTDVPHAHVHLVPFDESHELKRVLVFEQREPDHAQLTEIAKKIVLEDEK